MAFVTAAPIMLRQDYIKRVIEELASALARVSGLKASSPAEKLEVIQQAKQALPIVPGLLESGPVSRIAASLAEPELIRQLAELYRLESEQHKALENTAEAVRSMKRSLALFEAVQRDQEL